MRGIKKGDISDFAVSMCNLFFLTVHNELHSYTLRINKTCLFRTQPVCQLKLTAAHDRKCASCCCFFVDFLSVKSFFLFPYGFFLDQDGHLFHYYVKTI